MFLKANFKLKELKEESNSNIGGKNLLEEPSLNS